LLVKLVSIVWAIKMPAAHWVVVEKVIVPAFDKIAIFFKPEASVQLANISLSDLW
jgi:hypothetical protein